MLLLQVVAAVAALAVAVAVVCYFHLLVAADRCTARFTVSWPHADYACNKRVNRMSERDRETERETQIERERDSVIERGTPTRAGQVTNWPTDCFFVSQHELDI